MKDLRHRRAPEIDLEIVQAAVAQRRPDCQRARRYHRPTRDRAARHDAIIASRKKINEPRSMSFLGKMNW
ncbi:MAG: hypothetical protein WB476_03440 [Azonexus sp.]